MSDDRFAREKEIFLQAQERSGDERARYLDEVCGDDAALRAEVEALLDADERMAEAFDAPAVPDIEIDGFRIGRIIGEGGMGVVFEAEQIEPHRRVALKLLRFGLESEEMRTRFRYESETLGRLDHPGIARIYAAGVAQDRPWFAMEFVDGTPLTTYADEHGLDTKKRLELFAAICEAVQHAHARGIVHRDLKPTNILVDARGRPRLLDFGIAKSEAQQASLATRAGQLLGTIPYMSPEQVGGDPTAVHVASDVYALGVVLHELLARRRPLDLDAKPLPEAILAVRSEEPTRLGTLDTRWRGDIETIVAKALDKDPARRYENAGALAADIARHLADEPIHARPPTTAYQLRKFVRRNRALVAGVVATMFVLVAGIIATSLYALEADRQRARYLTERDEARRQEQRADEARTDAVRKTRTTQEALRFVTEIFYTGDPDRSRDVPPIPRLLARAAERVLALDMEPDVLGQLTHTIAYIQFNLGEYANAERLFARAAELAREVGDNDRLASNSMYLGRARTALRKKGPAIEAFGEALAALGENRPDKRALVLVSRGNLYQEARDRALAEKDFREALALSPQGETGSGAHLGLAQLLIASDEPEAALAQLDAAKRALSEGAGGNEIEAARAAAYARLGRHDEALASLDRLIAYETERLGPLHRSVFMLRNNRATALMRAGRAADAVESQKAVVADAGKVFDRNGPDYHHMLWVLVSARNRAGDFEGLAPVARRLAEYQKKRHGLAHTSTQSSMQALARALAADGRNEEAARVFEEAARGTDGVPKLRAWRLGHFTNAARFYLAVGKHEDAKRTARAAAMAAAEMKQPTYAQRILLARALLAGGDRERARKLAEGAVEEATRVAGAEAPATREARELLQEIG